MLTVLTGSQLQAQSLQPAPRLVVNIAVDQLRTDYIEHFAPLYCEDGFKKLLQNGRIYEAASYPFSPVTEHRLLPLLPPAQPHIIII